MIIIFVVHRACPKSLVDFLGPWTVHAATPKGATRQARTRRISDSTNSNTTAKMPSAYYFDMSITAKWLVQKVVKLSGHLAPGIRRAFPGHVRPASRDVSNDARSGNANRRALPQSPPEGGQIDKTVIQQHVPARVLIRVDGTAPDTIFSSQCKQNRHRQRRCKLLFLKDELVILRSRAASATTYPAGFPAVLGLAKPKASSSFSTIASNPGAKHRKRDRAPATSGRPRGA